MVVDSMDRRIVFGDEPKFENNANLPPKIWMESFIKFVEGLPPHEPVEVVIPETVDHIDLIVEFGLPQRDYEIGGAYNLKNRSMLLSRGNGKEERLVNGGSSQIRMPSYRRNEDLTTDDIYFHTHPLDVQATISHFRDPSNACEPSDTDTNNVLTNKMFEEELGLDTQVVSYVSSGGYLTKTEAIGMNISRDELVEAGVSERTIDNLLIELALAPNKYLVNFAKDPESAKLMMAEVQAYYAAKKDHPEVSYLRKLRELQEKIKKYCPDNYFQRIFQNLSAAVVDNVDKHFPVFQDRRSLARMGLNAKQIDLVEKMIGIKITKFKKEESGLKEIGVV